MSRAKFSNYCALVLFLFACAFFVFWLMQRQGYDSVIHEVANGITFAIFTGGAAIIGKVGGTIVGFVFCSR